MTIGMLVKPKDEDVFLIHRRVKALRKTGNMLNSRLNQGKSRPRAGQSRYSPKTALCLPVLPPFPPESF